MKVLIVGGTFDRQGGKPSGLINKIYTTASKKDLFDIEIYNGGFVDELKSNIIERCKNANITLWMPNVPNTEEKIRDVKAINHKTILITSKRNDDNKYTFAELISRSLAIKANLTVEFSKIGEKEFNMLVFDPLGNAYYNGTDIEEMTKKMFTRAIHLTRFVRLPSEKIGEKEDIPVPDETEFFNFAHDCADIFHNLIRPAKDTERFLGNMSFRCQNGFPSFKDNNGQVYVSKRNVDKGDINKDSFVPVKINRENGATGYYGDNKPSVDTPIQLRLYDIFSWAKYMLHAHCYFDTNTNIENCAIYTTSDPVPCGAIEEIGEILSAVQLDFQKVISYNESPELLVINLKGHGCLLIAKNIEALTRLKEHKDHCFVARKMPETIS